MFFKPHFPIILGFFWLILPWCVQAEVFYSGLIGGIDRGDGTALPALGFKLAMGSDERVTLTYGRGAVKSEGSYFEKEQVLSLMYKAFANGQGAVRPFLGIGGAMVSASSDSDEAKAQNSSVGAFTISSGANIYFLKLGVDTHIAIVPNTSPLYAVGVRNFWYLGFELEF